MTLNIEPCVCATVYVVLWIFHVGTYFHAATDVTDAKMDVFVTFPPKAPPILLT